MDTWMVAVAAGAGLIARHFKKCKQTGEQITPESSSNISLTNKPNSPKYPPDKKWPFRRSTKKDKSEVSQGVSDTEVTSTSEFDTVNGVISGNCEGSNVFSPSTIMSHIARSRLLLKNRRPIKPLTSLESCLMAQVETKEYISSPFASPSSQTTRPFLVTDGSKVINRYSGGSFIGSLNTIENDAMLNLCIGISFGILYSFMANRHEVEKLNRLLKQTENLVQDLEEELEMKDSLIMQELAIDDHKSQSPHNSEQSTDGNDKEYVVIHKTKDESFSKIEAELEMLELNMSSSTLERRISNLVEEYCQKENRLHVSLVVYRFRRLGRERTLQPCTEGFAGGYGGLPGKICGGGVIRKGEMLFWYRNEDGEFGSSSEIQITVQVSENTSQSSYSSTSPIFVSLLLDLCDQWHGKLLLIGTGTCLVQKVKLFDFIIAFDPKSLREAKQEDNNCDTQELWGLNANNYPRPAGTPFAPPQSNTPFSSSRPVAGAFRPASSPSTTPSFPSGPAVGSEVPGFRPMQTGRPTPPYGPPTTGPFQLHHSRHLHHLLDSPYCRQQ
ncbi:hypothetical protein L2E82_13096 [Cichorium intybus]|uniref:Uncharacterized protein n=1 Tax=Cichorium intybus TaxID=13427 RepID=A0ACB9GHX1_CICIN|nr:hypothetical protein L2E82_13096 [Cichorium intybus]